MNIQFDYPERCQQMTIVIILDEKMNEWTSLFKVSFLEMQISNIDDIGLINTNHKKMNNNMNTNMEVETELKNKYCVHHKSRNPPQGSV